MRSTPGLEARFVNGPPRTRRIRGLRKAIGEGVEIESGEDNVEASQPGLIFPAAIGGLHVDRLCDHQIEIVEPFEAVAAGEDLIDLLDHGDYVGDCGGCWSADDLQELLV